MNAAVVVTSPTDRPVHLTAVGARRLTDQIRHHLGSAITKLTQAREGGADTALGYDTWHAYVEAEFGDLRELRLPVVERRALVNSMRAVDPPMPVRAIAGKLGVSVGTVHGDLPETQQRATVTPLREAPQPAPTGRVYEQAAEYLRRQGERGLTRLELAMEAGWTEGRAGGALVDTVRVGLGARADVWRAGQRVFVAVGDR